MKKILIIGAGAMGAAFTVPCLDNKHQVTLSEPYNLKLVKKISLRNLKKLVLQLHILILIVFNKEFFK